MNKICTSIEQSKQLVDLGIDVNTADTWYQYVGDSFKDGITKPVYFLMVIRDDPSEKDIPAWSLSALLDYLCSIDMFPTIEHDDDQFKLILSFFEENEERPISDVKTIIIKNKELIDACVEMIVKLKNLDCYESKN